MLAAHGVCLLLCDGTRVARLSSGVSAPAKPNRSAFHKQKGEPFGNLLEFRGHSYGRILEREITLEGEAADGLRTAARCKIGNECASNPTGIVELLTFPPACHLSVLLQVSGLLLLRALRSDGILPR